MKVIVTGGAGFIGSHLVDRLIELDEDILVIDNFSTGSLDNIYHNLGRKNFNFIKSDLKKPEDWSPSFRGVDIVFHYASNPDIASSYMNPELHFMENVLTTYNVLEAARKYEVDSIIYASSYTVYGEVSKLPTPEDYHPLKPISTFGSFKLACEDLIRGYGEVYGIKYVILRYGEVIGGRSRRDMIYGFVKSLIDNPSVLEIRGDGTQKLSFIYINDAIDATIHIYRMLTENKVRDEIYNISSMDWITLSDAARIVVKKMKLGRVVFHLNPITKDGRGWIGEVKYSLPDITKLLGTGFKPRHNSSGAVEVSVDDYLKALKP